MRDLLPGLRQIGFGRWDPLGLSEAWTDGEPMADEYDSYLLEAFGKAVTCGDVDVIDHVLRKAEAKMGLSGEGQVVRRQQAAREILDLASRHAAG